MGYPQKKTHPSEPVAHFLDRSLPSPPYTSDLHGATSCRRLEREGATLTALPQLFCSQPKNLGVPQQIYGFLFGFDPFETNQQRVPGTSTRSLQMIIVQPQRDPDPTKANTHAKCKGRCMGHRGWFFYISRRYERSKERLLQYSWPVPLDGQLPRLDCRLGNRLKQQVHQKLGFGITHGRRLVAPIWGWVGNALLLCLVKGRQSHVGQGGALAVIPVGC